MSLQYDAPSYFANLTSGPKDIAVALDTNIINPDIAIRRSCNSTPFLPDATGSLQSANTPPCLTTHKASRRDSGQCYEFRWRQQLQHRLMCVRIPQYTRACKADFPNHEHADSASLPAAAFSRVCRHCVDAFCCTSWPFARVPSVRVAMRLPTYALSCISSRAPRSRSIRLKNLHTNVIDMSRLVKRDRMGYCSELVNPRCDSNTVRFAILRVKLCLSKLI